jgi:predicted adenine nucleotide alpha hydrolase (AANH) superfamily ATPase
LRVLLHTCCGPCAIEPVARLREEGHEVTGFWYNPNIHPYTEYQRRLEALRQFAAAVDLPLIVRDDYDLEGFIARAGLKRVPERCGECYRIRLAVAAEVAAEGGFDAFTTSLLVSPYQKHDLLKEVGEEAASAAGVPFLYRDWRPRFRAGRQRAAELGLYRQPYCGCIFSEKERYWRPEEQPPALSNSVSQRQPRTQPKERSQ